MGGNGGGGSDNSAGNCGNSNDKGRAGNGTDCSGVTLFDTLHTVKSMQMEAHDVYNKLAVLKVQAGRGSALGGRSLRERHHRADQMIMMMRS